MSGGPVDPADVPVYTGDLDVLEAKTKALSHGGSKVHTAGSDVHKSFGGLAAFYKAPEAEQLFGVTKPVERTAHDLGHDMHVIAGALSTYAREIRPLINRLKQLKQEAADFRDNEAAEDDWSEDGDLTDENLNRRNKIAEVWAAFQEAERDCHAKIVALVGGKALHTIDAAHKKGYGYDAEALKASKSLPWGEAVEESVPWWHVGEHAYDFGKGFIVDGVGGTIDGIYTLFGGHGSEAAGQAWTNLAKLGTALSITMTPAGQAYWMVPSGWLPPWLRESRDTMVEAGKGFVAWDQWESNGSRAAGAVTFNIVTAVFTRGGGAAVQGAGKAGALAKSLSVVSKVGSAVDPMTYVIKGAGAGLSKVGDGLAHLKGLGRVEAPKISEGAYSLPEGAVEMSDGTVQLPEGAAVPEGATKLPGGRIKLPEGTVTLPPHTVKDPFTGNFTDAAGHLYSKDDGSLLQDAKDAPQGKPAQPASGADNPRIDTPAHQEQRVPASVGGRGDDFTRVGSDIPDPARTSDNAGHGDTGPGSNTPMGRAGDHSAPSGSAGNHMPTNNLDDTPAGGGSRTATPTTSGGGSRDLPGGGSRDLPGGTTTDNGVHGSAHPGTPGSGSLDDAAHGADDTVGGSAGNDAATPGGGSPGPDRTPDPPSFMQHGDNPYGPPGSLKPEQIKEIQVWRANHEGGYFKEYYAKHPTHAQRLDTDAVDESGYPPPQLIKDPANPKVWIAKDSAPPPFPAKYMPDWDRGRTAKQLTDVDAHKVLDEKAVKRHESIRKDIPWHDPVSKAKNAWKSDGAPESKAAYEALKRQHAPFHQAMTEHTEAYGEAVAEHHVIREFYAGAKRETLAGPKNGNDQFDQLWRWKNDDGFTVFEAKSDVSTKINERTLPSGYKAEQASREYFLDIMNEMRKRGVNGNAKELQLYNELKQALKEDKVHYILVKGVSNGPSYGGFKTRRANIGKFKDEDFTFDLQ
ncbi:hypothetical protein [Streptomyces sp. G7(2002)]|uniref:hypothetical protein n=1 Tax=Streptomyces sp. G7(2002) TaxID=2971798 RepID=UPI00237E9C09|nr:hypothetical protein [Streptomyces sp. G7(2002)]WDT54125.1 hypothetical protein NUT86_08710 [Streptomyces sp. G7(2002)]